MSSMNVRDARPDEAKLAAEIQRDASVAGFAHIFPPERYPFPMDDVRARWIEALADPAASMLLAEADGRALGFAGVTPEWLDGLYVVPDAWGRGIGRLLHDRALARVRERGCDRCHLWVLEHNVRARRFYERLGWRENGGRQVVPFPPNPLEIGYMLDLDSRPALR